MKNFMRMIEDAKAGRFDLIITREVPRFAKKTIDTLQKTRKLKNIGVEIYFIDNNVQTFNDEADELKFTIMHHLLKMKARRLLKKLKLVK